MTRNLIFGLFLLLSAVPLCAQPTENAAGDGKPHKPVTMADFRYRPEEQQPAFAPVRWMQTKPGIALLGSAVIPGLGQAANNKWLRAGAYFLADALLLAVHIDSYNRALESERRYEEFADANWSVVGYAQWLVTYHDQNGIANPYLDQLRRQVEGVSPEYEPASDWNTVELELLRNVERNTPFITPDGPGNAFSHVMPDYGSQQYYELISKYYQFGPGWNDFGSDRDGNPLDSRYQLAWDGSDMPFNFFLGSDMAEQFNDKYRLAGNMISLMILNHVISAFDALLTVKIKNNRLQTETSLIGTNQITLKYRF